MKPWAPSENADVAPVTKENILATTTTTTALKSLTVHTHIEVTAYLGETVQFECQSQGHPQPRITWVLPDREIVSVLPNGTLHMKSVSHMDRGIYKCIASNAAGADTISVRLTIAALPPIIQQPRNENITLPEGSTAYLNCTARGVPPPAIGWITPGGMQLHPSQFINGHNFFVFPNGTLYVRSLSPTDAGRYECSVTNVVGTAWRAIILTCTAIKIIIIFMILYFSYDQRIKVSANGTLSIVSVTEKDEGEYLCVVRNKI
uniref:Matrix-remodelling associated 5a n=2 Tax=Cyprinus carpio TaxID=7962 RepID=A0A8C1RAY3_CYPCA